MSRPPKPKQDIQIVRYENAKKMLAKWQRKVKAATIFFKKWQRKVRHYEAALATAGKIEVEN